MNQKNKKNIYYLCKTHAIWKIYKNIYKKLNLLINKSRPTVFILQSSSYFIFFSKLFNSSKTNILTFYLLLRVIICGHTDNTSALLLKLGKNTLYMIYTIEANAFRNQKLTYSCVKFVQERCGWKQTILPSSVNLLF